jgi:hypothetical protein
MIKKNKSRKIIRKTYVGGDRNSFQNRFEIPNNGLPSNLTKNDVLNHSNEPYDIIPPPTEDYIVAPTSTPTDSIVASDIMFQFTRHLLSCNNIDEGKWYSFGKDFEPGATVYGIIETIKYAQREDQQKYFNFEHVFVSNLYRTWITAVLLYGTNLTATNTLHLYISPYLKEFHGTIMGVSMKRGNFPKEIHHMAAKFLKFLETIHNNTSLFSQLDGTQSWYENLPNTIILHLPPSVNKEQTIEYKKVGSDTYKLTNFCDIKDTAGPNSGSEFTTTGNLQKFMEWYNSDSNYYGKHNDNNKVHIVTHSHIMRDYLASFKFKTSMDNSLIPFDLDKLKTDPDIKQIRNSNSWHFITTQNKQLNTLIGSKNMINEFNIIPGVPSKPLGSESPAEIESKNKEYSLCNTEGSVKPATEICGLNKNGGKKKTIRKSKKLVRKTHKHK